MKKAIVASIILLFCFCTQNEDTQIEPKDVVDLLPLDGEVSGWSKSSATEIAENESQLWDLINGEGQVCHCCPARCFVTNPCSVA